jgi:hypothetical protein
MSDIAGAERETAGNPDYLRAVILATFLVGMTTGLLLSIAWDAVLGGQPRSIVELTSLSMKARDGASVLARRPLLPGDHRAPPGQIGGSTRRGAPTEHRPEDVS